MDDVAPRTQVRVIDRSGPQDRTVFSETLNMSAEDVKYILEKYIPRMLVIRDRRRKKEIVQAALAGKIENPETKE